MPNALHLTKVLVAVLATWRLASMLYYQNGVFEKLRARVRYLDCFWCCTNVAACIILPLYVWFWWAMLPLSFSGGAILLTQGGRIIYHEMVEHGTK